MKVFRSSHLLLTLGALIMVGALAWQQWSIQQLRDAIAERPALPPTGAGETISTPVERPEDSGPLLPSDQTGESAFDSRLERRVAALEASVSRFDRNADHLMDRGVLPPTAAKLAAWSTIFLDPYAERDARLSALSRLRQNDGVTPQVAQVAAAWLDTSTDPDLTRRLLDILRGVKDPTLKTATLNLVATTAEPRVRERALMNLRDFVEDPAVQAALWQVVAAKPSDIIERRARDALRRIPMTDALAVSLESRALDPAATLEEQLMSLRLLRAGDKDVTRIAPTLAQAAQSATDSETRVKYYAAFDDVNDPSFMLPLVEGAQDADARVRGRAADALLDYRSEPTITDLLKAMAESDPDPGVRQQAARIFRYERR